METLQKIKTVEAKRRVRIVDPDDIAMIENALPSAPDDITTVRLYGLVGGGFVPSSYKYRCPITAVTWTRGVDEWTVEVVTTDAKRSGGKGPEVTVNSRTAITLAEIEGWKS